MMNTLPSATFSLTSSIMMAIRGSEQHNRMKLCQLYLLRPWVIVTDCFKVPSARCKLRFGL